MSNEKDQVNLMAGSAPPPPPAVTSAGLMNGYPTSGAPPGFPPLTQAPPPYTQYGHLNGAPPPMAFYPMMPGAMYPHHPGGPMTGPPPPYDPQQIPHQQPPGPQQIQGHPQMGYAPFYPGQPMAAFPPTPYGAFYHPSMYPMYPMMQPLPPNMAVVMPDGFDPSARFDGVSRPSVPPPPPGVAPNLAQQALMYGQGNQVVVGQKKASFF